MLIDILVINIKQMTLIKMEQSPHNLQKMECNGKVASELLELSVSVKKTTMYYIGVKG